MATSGVECNISEQLNIIDKILSFKNKLNGMFLLYAIFLHNWTLLKKVNDKTLSFKNMLNLYGLSGKIR